MPICAELSVSKIDNNRYLVNAGRVNSRYDTATEPTLVSKGPKMLQAPGGVGWRTHKSRMKYLIDSLKWPDDLS